MVLSLRFCSERLVVPSLLLIVLCTGVLLSGCSTGFREFLGLDEAELVTSVADLKNYHAPLVLINRADRLFDKRNYPEAAMSYKRFLELHRVHRKADYAQYRMGLSYLKQFRSIDRDPEPVTKALATFTQFLGQYPDSLYASDVRSQLATTRGYLAAYELYVGRFYYKQKAYPAAISRLEGILDDYGDLPAAEEALFLLGRAYEASGRLDHAKQILQRLIQRYPDSSYQEQAQKQLARLNGHDA